MAFFRRNNKSKRKTRILFATDIHGAESVFKKFLNAAKIYNANVCVIGGDITGKGIVPIIHTNENDYSTHLMGIHKTAKGEEQLAELLKEINFLGMYSYVTTEEQVIELNKSLKAKEALFKKVIVERVESWIGLVEERLKDTDIKCYITGGNDDPFIIEESLNKASGNLFNAEAKVIKIDERHEMLSSGYGNITPWNCPRDITEDELEKKIESMIAKVKNMKDCIFNLHIPPIDSGLATCVKLDTTVDPPKPIIGMETCAGSTAVRKVIEKYQPLISVHGHIHESRGIVNIGRTICINPGSEYSEGVLRAAVIDLDLDSDNKPMCQLINV